MVEAAMAREESVIARDVDLEKAAADAQAREKEWREMLQEAEAREVELRALLDDAGVREEELQASVVRVCAIAWINEVYSG